MKTTTLEKLRDPLMQIYLLLILLMILPVPLVLICYDF